MKSIFYFFLTIFLTIQSSEIFSQKGIEKIDYISFTFTHSRRIPYNYIQIEFFKSDSSAYIFVQSKAMNDNKKWKYSTFLKHYDIDLATFRSLVQKIQRFNNIDLDKTRVNGRDGNKCSIALGIKESTIAYSFWTPNYETKNRGLTEFYAVCKSMIKLGRLKVQDIF